MGAIDLTGAVAEEIRDRLPADGAASEATLLAVEAAIEALSGIGGGGGTTGGALEATQLDVRTAAQAAAASLVSILGAVDGLEGFTDGLEALLGRLPSGGAASEATAAAILTALASVAVTGTVTAQDGGGSLTVDDGGGSITVDGAVTATISDGSGPVTVDGTVAVTDGGGSLTVDGTVAISNLNADPATGTAQTTQVTRLTEIRDYLDTVETSLAAASTAANQATQTTRLTEIRDYLDTVETLLGTAATAANQATANTSLATIAAGVVGEKRVTGSTAVVGDVIPWVDMAGYNGVSVEVTGTWTGTYVYEQSNDQTNVSSLFLTNAAGVPSTATTGPVSGNAVRNGVAAMRYVRVRAVTLSAGTMNAALRATPYGLVPLTVTVDSELPTAAALSDTMGNLTVPSVGAAMLGFDGTNELRLRGDVANGLDVDVTRLPSLVSGSAIVGSAGTFARNVWQDDSTATLASAATFTGTARDMLGVAAGTSMAGGQPHSFVAAAVSDVTGTLYVEVSRDNTTFRRAFSVAMTQDAGASNPFSAVLEVPVFTRYYRLAYVNGAGAQSYFMAQTMQRAVA